MRAQSDQRFKKRVPCALRLGERRYSGVLLDFSRTGLFVQTGATATRGDEVEVRIRSLQGVEIPLNAEVVWQRRVAPQLRNLAAGGIGLRIRTAPEAYFELLATALGRGGKGKPDAGRAKPTTWAKTPPLEGFRVRVQQESGPRSRVLEIRARDSADAGRKALARLEGAWRVVEVESQG